MVQVYFVSLKHKLPLLPGFVRIMLTSFAGHPIAPDSGNHHRGIYRAFSAPPIGAVASAMPCSWPGYLPDHHRKRTSQVIKDSVEFTGILNAHHGLFTVTAGSW